MNSSTAAVYLPGCPSSLLIWAWVRSTGNTVTFPPNPAAFAAKARACGQASFRSVEHTTNIGAGAVVETARTRVLASTYRRWFLQPAPTGELLNLPMSVQLAEVFRGMGAED